MIEKLCRRVFTNNPDVKYYAQHKELLFFITDIYLPYCNSENGDYNELLVGPTILDEPYITRQIINLIKLNFKIHISEEREKKAAELKSKSKRGRR